MAHSTGIYPYTVKALPTSEKTCFMEKYFLAKAHLKNNSYVTILYHIEALVESFFVLRDERDSSSESGRRDKITFWKSYNICFFVSAGTVWEFIGREDDVQHKKNIWLISY